MLELAYPTLTAMLDGYFRHLGDGDEAAVEAFYAAGGDEARAQVLAELRELAASQHDALDLRAYLMMHRFDMIPDGGAEAWLGHLEALLEREI